MLRRALRHAWPAARRFGWQVGAVQELDPGDNDVGYTGEDGTLFVKVRDPTKGRSGFYTYSYVLATLLHELTHLSVLGHGKGFYRRFVEAVGESAAEPALKHQVHAHICAELLNAVCDNDARRARGLLAILPEAAQCRLQGVGNQLPLEYAAHHGRVALTKLLLEARADADASCRADGVPPLAIAAARGNCKTAKLLLDAGAMRGRAALESLDSPIFAVDTPTVRAHQERSSSAGAIRSLCDPASALRHRRRRKQGLPRAESLPLLPPPDASAASGAAPSSPSKTR